MEGSNTEGVRRIVAILAFAAIVIIFVSGLIIATFSQITSLIGGILAAAAWGLAIVTAARNKQGDWVLLLAAALVLCAITATYGVVSRTEVTPVTHIVPQLGGLGTSFIASAYAALGAHGATDRGVPSYTGVWALLTLVVGGTLVGGAIGTDIGAAAPYILAVGFNLYVVAGILALFAWATGLIAAFRVGATGWTMLVVLLPSIGAFMFGLFGPSRQDVLLARDNARERKAVGLQ
jgi:hypothetical protein